MSGKQNKDTREEWRLKLADKLMRFCLDRRLRNNLLVNVLFKIYTLLISGVYVLSHTDANHHYIPQFLLRNFKIPNTGSIYEYTFNAPPKAVSISKQAASAPNLYSFRDKSSKQQSDFLEKHLFAYSVEKYASRIINLILEDPDAMLTHLEESILTSFVGLQYTRTPDFLFHIKSIIVYLSKARNISLEEMIESDFYKKAFLDNYYNITAKEVGRFALEHPWSITGADDLILKIMVSIGNDLSPLIYQRNMLTVKAREPAFFFLGGSPVEIYNLSLKRGVGPFLWEIDKNTLIFIPLSPDTCLYYLPKNLDVSASAIGNIIEQAMQDMITAVAYSDRKSNDIENIFRVALST